MDCKKWIFLNFEFFFWKTVNASNKNNFYLSKKEKILGFITFCSTKFSKTKNITDKKKKKKKKCWHFTEFDRKKNNSFPLVDTAALRFSEWLFGGCEVFGGEGKRCQCKEWFKGESLLKFCDTLQKNYHYFYFFILFFPFFFFVK